jgi:hypothetical protein
MPYSVEKVDCLICDLYRDRMMIMVGKRVGPQSVPRLFVLGSAGADARRRDGGATLRPCQNLKAFGIVVVT